MNGMAATILRVSVLSSGEVLLDGNPVTPSRLAEIMDATPKGETAVWYYRETAAGEPPEIARQVIQLIADRRLPVRLSTKPDFSDAVTPDLASAYAPLFNAIRERAAQRRLIILRPDRGVAMLPAMDRDKAPAAAVAAMERLLPPETPRNVAVIADTSWTVSGAPNLQDAAKAIPFFGLLMGLASIGHSVWIFDGSNAGMVAAGCREADLAIIDSARMESLPAQWQQLMKPVMRNAQILVHDRATHQLRKP